MAKTSKTDVSAFITGLVRIPVADHDPESVVENPLYVALPEITGDGDILSGLWIAEATHDFERDGNPVRAFEAFFNAVELGYYPPLDVLRWMAATLREYHDEQGMTSLDDCFGVSLRQGQKYPPYKKLLMRDRDEAFLHYMDCLMYLGASRDDAAEMVSRKMEADDWNKTQHEMVDLKADSLKDMHKKSKRPKLDTAYAEMMGLNSPDGKRSFIGRFPYIAPSIGV